MNISPFVGKITANEMVKCSREHSHSLSREFLDETRHCLVSSSSSDEPSILNLLILAWNLLIKSQCHKECNNGLFLHQLLQQKVLLRGKLLTIAFWNLLHFWTSTQLFCWCAWGKCLLRSPPWRLVTSLRLWKSRTDMLLTSPSICNPGLPGILSIKPPEAGADLGGGCRGCAPPPTPPPPRFLFRIGF